MTTQVNSGDTDGTMARVVCRLMVAAAIALWALPVGAQDDPGEANGGDDGVESFRALVARGAKLRKNHQYRAALDRFKDARAIADHPKLMMVTAELREKIGDCAAARDDLQRGLDDKRTSDVLRAKIEAALEANRRCVSRGTVVIDCTPHKADVVAGEHHAACGEAFALPTGAHSLTVQADGYDPRTLQISVAPGERQTHHVALDSTPTRSPVVADQKHSVKPAAWPSYLAYTAVGVGAALVVSGVISDATAISRRDQLEQARDNGDFAAANRLVDEASAARTRTIVLLSSGAVLAVAGGVLWAYDGEVGRWLGDPDTAAVEPRLSVGAHRASIHAAIRW